MLSILIPTYNRASDLEKNLKILIRQIQSQSLADKIKISVSNNCSTDHTSKIIQDISNSTDLEIDLYEQSDNIGLEANALFLLEKSHDDYIMYLGDDDFLPEGYLSYALKHIEQTPDLSCIIPGFSALFPDGHVEASRDADFEELLSLASFKTVMTFSQFGHQLSGLCLRRQGLYETYTATPTLRNIYLFVFFVTYSNYHGTTVYAPKYQVLVSQGNSKDWKYDDSGLLTEIFKNYKIVFKDSYIKRNIMNFVFMNQQIWRLRVGIDFKTTYLSFMSLQKDPNLDLLTKLLLPFYYLYLYLRGRFLRIKKELKKIKLIK